MISLTVELHKLFFLQDLIVFLVDTHAASRQQHCYKNSRHDSHGVD